MLGDSRECILFLETSCYKKIKANGLVKIMDLTYLMHRCHKGPLSQDEWKIMKVQVPI